MPARRRLVRSSSLTTTRPPVVLLAGTPSPRSGLLAATTDAAGRAREALAVQATAGNRAVQRAIVDAGVAVGYGTCSTPDLACSAKANRSFDSGVNPGTTKKSKDNDGNVVYVATATASAAFKTAVEIHLAQVPDGLSACAAGKLKRLVDTKLAAHEQDHKRRFLTTDPAHSYIGRWSKKVTAASDDRATAESEAMAKGQTALDDEAAAREQRNDAYAIDAIDPFSVSADISDCPECQDG